MYQSFLVSFAFFECRYYKDQNGNVWAESRVFVSDDLTHDNVFFAHCADQLIEEYSALLGGITHVHVWSDGCGAQVPRAMCVLAALAILF